MDDSSSELSASEARRKLEEMFKGIKSESPQASSKPRARRQSFSQPKRSGGRAPTEYRMRLERLRSARDEAEIVAAADVFLKHHQLPDEPSVLYKVLSHPNEAHCRAALGELSSLLMQGRLESTSLLGQHLRDLRGRCSEKATISFIDGMEAQLAK